MVVEKPAPAPPKKAYEMENYADDTNILIEEVKKFGSFESSEKDNDSLIFDEEEEEKEHKFASQKDMPGDDMMEMHGEVMKKKLNDMKRGMYQKKTVKLESKILENSNEES